MLSISGGLHTMENTEENLTASKEAGSVKISNDVISIIAALAIKDMDEVRKNTSKVRGKDKSIEVTSSGRDVVINVDLSVPYGTKIPKVASEVQEKIKTSVENMTGLNVKEVNVIISGMNISQDEH